MSGAIASRDIVPTATSLFDRERIIAMPGFNRWLVPPAALIHLCIGMAYGFSVFWMILSRALGVTQPVTMQARSSNVTSTHTGSLGIGGGAIDTTAVLAWTAVGIPMLWGVWTTLQSALALFR